MSPNGISPSFDKILIISSSESSDSESLLQEDIKSPGSGINRQWEAIERTLYQEPGEQVTDPELVKECKLWRETFPHFRVKGTKVDVKLPENDVSEAEKNTETLKKHFNLKKLEEKRESIKKKVVGMLVDRLVAKYGVTNVNSGAKNGHEKPKASQNAMKSIKYYEPSNSKEKESYFERGKTPPKVSDPDEGYISREQAEKSLYEIFDSWEKDCESATKLPKTYLKGDPKKLPNDTPKNSFSRKPSPPKPNPGRFKKPPSSTPYDEIKPFQLTTKIDKKYDALIERIMERRHRETGTAHHCPTSATGVETKSYQESLEKLRMGDGFNDLMKRNTMPRINKFNNNWLKRREINRCREEDSLLLKKSQSIKPERHPNLNIFNENGPDETQERFLGDLNKKVGLRYKKPERRNGFVEGIHLQRPEPLKPLEKPPKSSSFGDFQRKSKKEAKVRRAKNGLEPIGKGDLNFKTRIKPNNFSKKESKLKANQNPILPPIECGLICTELPGRPKIGPRIPARRY